MSDNFVKLLTSVCAGEGKAHGGMVKFSPMYDGQFMCTVGRDFRASDPNIETAFIKALELRDRANARYQHEKKLRQVEADAMKQVVYERMQAECGCELCGKLQPCCNAET